MEANDVFFTWNDLKRLFLRRKKIYFSLFKVSFFAVLLFYFIKPPLYEATALFKQSTQNSSKTELLRSFLPSDFLESKESGAQSVFESRTLLKQVVEKLGLQVVPHRSVFSLSFFYRLKDSFLSELGMKIPDRRKFQFSSVSFEESVSSSFFLQFSDAHFFTVWNKEKQKIGEGQVGKPVSISGISFTLDETFEKVKLGRFYRFEIKPWVEVVKKVRLGLKVKPSKTDKNILHLSFLFPNSKIAAQFINCLMGSYQDYLKGENQEISHLHMQYLDHRQTELIKKYEKALEDHVAFLGQSLKETGFINLKQEIEVLEKPNEEYISRLYDVDLQLSRLTSIKSSEEEKQKTILKNKITKKTFREKNSSTNHALETLYAKKEGEFLEVDLQKGRFVEDSEWVRIRDLIGFFEGKNSLGDIPNGLPSEIKRGLEELESCYAKYRSSETKGDPLVFLEIEQKKQQMKPQALFELKKLKQEVCKDFNTHELEGINPETVQRLYVEYNQQLDALYVSTEQLLDLKEKIPQEEFEISSLSGFLTDSVSQEMIQKASQRALELQDKANYSERDIERIQSGLLVQKRFLLQHIDQMISMQKLRANLIREKIDSLQKTSIHQLEVEKKLIQEQLGSLQERMKTFPEKWKKENELMMKRDLSLKMIEGLTQLTESKNIHHQLFQVDSKPIDRAFVPQKPSERGAFPFSLLAGVLVSGIWFVKDFLRWLSQGATLTEDFLKAKKIFVCGFLSDSLESRFEEACFEEKETLRKACSFLQEVKQNQNALCVSMTSSSPPVFCKQIANLLSLRGHKVLVIECSASLINRSPNRVGLYEYLSTPEKEPTVLSQNGFDCIEAGSYVGHFMESLYKESFKDLICRFSDSYDFIFLSMQTDLFETSFSPLKNLSDAWISCLSQDVLWENVADFAEKKPFAVVFLKSSGK